MEMPRLLRFLDVVGNLGKHGEAAGDMEAADDDGNAGRPKRPADIQRAGEFIRLRADDADEAEIAMRP